jgi:ubiquitin-conjugating enzyme E2 M
MSELQLPSNITINFPEGKDKLTHFEIVLRPDEGIYK